MTPLSKHAFVSRFTCCLGALDVGYWYLGSIEVSLVVIFYGFVLGPNRYNLRSKIRILSVDFLIFKIYYNFVN